MGHDGRDIWKEEKPRKECRYCLRKRPAWLVSRCACLKTQSLTSNGPHLICLYYALLSCKLSSWLPMVEANAIYKLTDEGLICLTNLPAIRGLFCSVAPFFPFRFSGNRHNESVYSKAWKRIYSRYTDYSYIRVSKRPWLFICLYYARYHVS